MAVQTIYILATVAVTPNWFGNTQLNGSAPTAASSAYGWVPGTTATTTPYRRARLGATTTGTDTASASSFIAAASSPTVGTGSGATTAGDSFVAGPFTGVFAAGAWTFNWNMRASTAGAKGAIRMRVWKSANANGSAATELTSGPITGTTITLSTTADANTATAWSPAAFVCNNEYLFFQLEWQETTAGTSGTNNVFFRAGTTSIVTTNLGTQWQGSATLAGAGSLTADATRVPASTGGTTSTVFSNNVLHYTFDNALAPESLLHFDGTNGSTTFTDIGAGGHTWAIGAGASVLDTSQSKFGGSALHLTGAGDGLFGDGTINFGINDFTIDCWVYRTNTADGHLFGWNAVYYNVYIDGASNLLRFYHYSADAIVGSTAVTNNAWHHVALTRSNGTTYLFLDGQLQGSVADPTNYSASASYPTIGLPGYSPVGWIDEFRIVVGNAAWTATFTPPTAAYGLPAVSAIADFSTSAPTSILHFDGANNSTTITDATGNHLWTISGAAVLDTSQSQFGSASFHVSSATFQLLFGDGTINWGTSDFTVDFWVKLNGTQASSTNLFYMIDTGGLGGVIYISAPGGVLRLYAIGSDRIVGTTAVTTSVWHHMAVTRQSNTHYLFLDGNLEGTWVALSTMAPPAPIFR